MNRSEVVCRNSPGYWDLAYATQVRDTITKLSGFQFRIYACRCCTKYHLTARTERVKA